MLQPLVSIIIPTYNRASQIGETIDSVISQSYSNWECLIIDDGSSDYTEDLLDFYCKRNSKIKFYKRDSSPKGAPHCRNIGLDKAQGQFCIFLDSDDILLDFCLEERVKKTKIGEKNDFWVFPMYVKNTYGKYQLMEIPQKESYLEDFLKCKVHWQTMCTLWDINFVRSISGFKENYLRLNDPEIHIRAMVHSIRNYTVFWDSKPDSVYRPAILKVGTNLSFKYYQSLMLFIPDLSSLLKENSLSHLRHNLKGYLNDYLRESFRFISRQNNLRLFMVFYKNRILTFYQLLLLAIQYYLLLGFDVSAKKVRRGIHKLLEL
ncbi:glycosyltransferase family 2 protein [Christiangramia crocea]|uniref:Glycosyltransferase family 2 protein n=1 Tax=Christiangramia crocea TaxID=2904124 RepID=A0A9X2A908_9FLAO|nr:glycosyltransferase family 2 protein [Gramella crocea]MCG9973022.1 glycosyltransferase family 2 protein [Gramella crocea]